MQRTITSTVSLLAFLALTVVSGFGAARAEDKPAPTIEECGIEMEKADRFFDENEDKAEALMENPEIQAAMDKAFEQAGFQTDAYEHAMTLLLHAGLEMAGANVDCAAVVASAMAEEMQASIDEEMTMLMDEYGDAGPAEASPLGECEAQMRIADRFFDENPDTAEALLDKYDFEPLMDRAFSGEEFDFDEYRQRIEALLTEGLEMAGANVDCAAVVAVEMTRELQADLEEYRKLMESMEELNDMDGTEE